MNSRKEAAALDDRCTRLLEFFECAIHQILYARNIYPSQAFEKARKYDLAVRMSRHPGLNEYIHETLWAAKPFMKNNSAEKLVVLVFTPEEPFTILERFVFKFSMESVAKEVSFDRIRQRFFDSLLKITLIPSKLSPIPDKCKFKLLLYTSRYDPVADAQHAPFLFCHSNEDDSTQPRTEMKPGEFSIVPLKSMKCGGQFDISIFVEELAAKQKIDAL